MPGIDRPGVRGDGMTYPLGLYASAIDESDYVAKVAPLVRELVPDRGTLMDIGAGGGQMGAALRMQGQDWTAIEPAPVMQQRLRALQAPPNLVPYGWRDAGEVARADTVFAATMPAYLTDTQDFFRQCRAWAKRQIIWIVPAQNGPRGLILSACLPREWHREDETPGIDLVLPALEANPPHHMRVQDWTFSLTLKDLPFFASWQADRLGWADDDSRRAELFAHLKRKGIATSDGVRLSCPRRSAILVWNLP